MTPFSSPLCTQQASVEECPLAHSGLRIPRKLKGLVHCCLEEVGRGAGEGTQALEVLSLLHSLQPRTVPTGR